MSGIGRRRRELGRSTFAFHERWIVVAVLLGSVFVAGRWGVLNAWLLLPAILAPALFVVGFSVRHLRSRLSDEEVTRGSLVGEIRELTGESERRIRELRTLYESSLIVSQSVESADLVSSLAEDARQVVGAEVGCVFLVEGDRVKTVRQVGDDRLGPFHLLAGEELSSKGLVAHILTNGEPIVVSDVAEDARMEGAREVTWTRVRSLLAVPLASGGHVFGGILLGSGESSHFTGEEVRVLTILGNLASAALEKLRLSRELTERVRELATRSDELRTAGKLTTRVVSTLAREIRGPIASVRLLSRTLNEAAGLAGANLRRPVTEAIARETDRALHTADALEALDRNVLPSDDRVVEEARIADHLHEIVVKHTASAVRRGILLKASAPPAEMNLHCDCTGMREGLDFLFEYLVRGIEKDSVLSVTLEQEAGVGHIVVSGEGSAEFVEGTRHGLGCGSAFGVSNVGFSAPGLSVLALTRAAVTRNGGTLRVDPGTGGTFQIVVSLPLSPNVPALSQEVLRALVAGPEHSRLLDLTTALAAELVGARQVTLFLLDTDSRELFVQAAHRQGAVEAEDLRVPLGHRLVGQVAETGHSAVGGDLEDSGKPRLAVPLRWKSKILGVLEVGDKTGDTEFRKPDLHLVEHLAALISRSLARQTDLESVKQELVKGLMMMATVAGSAPGESGSESQPTAARAQLEQEDSLC